MTSPTTTLAGYRPRHDPMRILFAETTSNSAASFDTILAESAVATLSQASRQAQQNMTASDGTTPTQNGLIELEPYDGVELFVLGTDAANETALTLVTALTEIWNPANAPSRTPDAYFQEGLALLTWTLGTADAGGNASAVTGIETGDLWADTVTADSTHLPPALDEDDVGTPGLFTNSRAANAVARVQIFAPCRYMYVQLYRSTAATCLCIGRRIMRP